MKKIFYILASAIVALGAVACENDVMDNIATENEGLSFVATIDNSKTDLDGLKTVWSDDDVITINKFEFAHQGEGKFTCTDSEVSTLKGQSNLIAWYNEDGIDSEAGTAGAQLKAEGAFDAEGNASGFSFAVQNAFLKVTTKGQFKDDFVLTGAGMFSEGDAFSIAGEVTDKYIAIKPTDAETTLTYSIGGVAQKVANIKFEAGKIYNLGELTAEQFENWGVIGAHTNWDQANTQALYKIPTSKGTYSRGNVTLKEGGCLFLKQTVETEIIHHPEVTGGESGDWYLTPNSNWKQANARFAIYFFNASGNTWVDMKDENGDGIYVADTPDGKWTSMIFCRMNPSATANNWDNKWNQTADLSIPNDGNNHYTVKAGTWDKGGGTWAVHTPVEHQDAWDEEVEKIVQVWANVNGDFKVGSWFTTYSNTTYTGNMNVTDYEKTYDLFIHTGEAQSWGYTIDVAIVEHNAEDFDLETFLGEY